MTLKPDCVLCGGSGTVRAMIVDMHMFDEPCPCSDEIDNESYPEDVAKENQNAD